MANFNSPKFGANMGGQGVLPSGNANRSFSASSPASNQMSFADGGMIDDTDTGNAETGGPLNPMAMLDLDQRLAGSGAPMSENVEDRRGAPRDILLALEFGRNLFNVGQVFKKGLKDADAEFKRQNESMFGKKPDESGAGGFDEAGFADQPEEDMQFAEGGVIPEGDEGSDPDNDGDVHPSGGAQPSQQSAMAYLSGQGAVGPDVAQAMEQQVDPQGMMDPSERKMQAITKAGSPDKAFALMQHYRQKFMAYNSFAKAALQGAGGRPPNPAAAADALTKAYENVPDGQSMRFTPTRGGMQVQVRKHQQPQQFAEGGVVGYDDTYESPSEDQALRDAPAVDPSDAIAQAEGEGPASLGRTIMLGWNSLMKMLEGPGLDYDKAVEDPNSLASAAPESITDETAGGTVDPWQDANVNTSRRPTDQAGQNMMQDPYYQGQPRPSPARDWRTHPVSSIVQEAQQDPNANTLEHQLYLNNLAYSSASQQQQRALGEIAIRQAWAKNQFGLDKEQVKANAALERAHLSADTKERIANLSADAKKYVVDTATQSAERRVMTAYQGKIDLAAYKATTHWQEIMGQEIGKAERALIGAGVKPGRVGEALKEMPATMPSQNPAIAQGQQPQAPQAQAPQAQAPQAQAPQRGNLPTPPDGMKYQLNTKTGQYRLVPVQP